VIDGKESGADYDWTLVNAKWRSPSLRHGVNLHVEESFGFEKRLVLEVDGVDLRTQLDVRHFKAAVFATEDTIRAVLSVNREPRAFRDKKPVWRHMEFRLLPKAAPTAVVAIPAASAERPEARRVLDRLKKFEEAVDNATARALIAEVTPEVYARAGDAANTLRTMKDTTDARQVTSLLITALVA